MTEEQARAKIKAAGKSWDKFGEWMYGQTVGMVDGKAQFYDYDVERFIKTDGVYHHAEEWD